MISARVYKQQLDETLVSPAARRAADVWLKQAEEKGLLQIKMRRQFIADRLNNAQAENFNVNQIAEAISDALDSGKLSPSDALGQLAQLRQIRAAASQELPRALPELTAIDGLDPLAVFDEFLQTFPALAERQPPQPPLA